MYSAWGFIGFFCEMIFFLVRVLRWTRRKFRACRLQRNAMSLSFFSLLQMATKDRTGRMTQWDENLIKISTQNVIHFLLSLFLQILITGLYGCRNYSYLNGGIKSDKCFKRTTAQQIPQRLKRCKNPKVLISFHVTAGRDTVSVDCKALKIKLSSLINACCRCC